MLSKSYLGSKRENVDEIVRGIAGKYIDRTNADQCFLMTKI